MTASSSSSSSSAAAGPATASSAPSGRTTVKRGANRAQYDPAVVEAIIDEANLCHVGTVQDGVPMVIPTLHVRIGQHLVLHGSPASKMLRTARSQEICVNITLVDGYVLARSAFHHSMNYRSVVLIGQPEPVPAEEKPAALDALTEKLVPGRIPHLRPMTGKEVKGTALIRIPITEASAKVRTGPPNDDAEDYDLPIWAGVVPIETQLGSPIADPAMKFDLDVPDHVKHWTARS